MEFEVAKIGERGQVVIPQSFRSEMGIHKGEKFMIIRRGDLLVFKRVHTPSMEEFDKMLKKGHAHAEKHRLKPRDAEEALRNARRR